MPSGPRPNLSLPAPTHRQQWGAGVLAGDASLKRRSPNALCLVPTFPAYPQTSSVYRSYQRWLQSGALNEILGVIYEHLQQHAGA
jgi:hypothetical protein